MCMRCTVHASREPPILPLALEPSKVESTPPFRRRSSPRRASGHLSGHSPESCRRWSTTLCQKAADAEPICAETSSGQKCGYCANLCVKCEERQLVVELHTHVQAASNQRERG